MKRITVLALLFTMLLGYLAPLSKAEAFNNIVIQSASGMEVYTPTPSEMKVGKFQMTFQIKIRSYIDATGKTHYIDDYRAVRWDIKGCGINEDLRWTREDNLEQLKGTLPTLIVTGNIRNGQECTIDSLNTYVMPCEADASGSCRNNDMVIPAPVKIDLSMRNKVVNVTGERRVKQGGQYNYTSDFVPADKEIIEAKWAWSATTPKDKTCSRPTYHNGLNPVFDALIKSNAKGTCKVKVNAVYLTGVEGNERNIRFGLKYVGGFKNIVVIKGK